MTNSTSGASVHEAFAQLARIALADSSMHSVMTKVAEISRRVVPGADEVSVTLVEKGDARTVASTGQLAVDLDEVQYAHDRGPCLASIAEGGPVEIPVIADEHRWPEFVTAAVGRGAGSSLSVPVPVQRGVAAALNLYSRHPRAFDDEGRALADAIADYAAVAIANMHVYEAQSRVAEQLQTAMQSRAVIEQAKGILMGRQRCTADEAFAQLVALSQRSNRKLRDVAQVLVEGAQRDAGER
jgi:GAF domain-containing protein